MKKSKHKIQVALTSLYLLIPSVVYADTADDMLAPVNRFVQFIMSAIRLVGIVILAFNLFQFFSSLRSHDATQRDNAILGIVAGVGIALISTLINWLIG